VIELRRASKMFLTSVCVLLVFLIWTFLRIKTSRRNFLLSKIPSPKKIWLFHNTFEIVGLKKCELFKKLETLKTSFGDVFHLTFHPFDCGTIFVTDYETLKVLSLHQPDRTRSVYYKSISRWVGLNGLFLAGGNHQKSRLKFIVFLLGSKFHHKYIRLANHHLNAAMNDLRGKDLTQFNCFSWANKVVLDVVFGMKAFCFDTVL
jgi:hypothetical protein